jgi:aminoglycoside phosphotransferase (APT) family kinase protein
MPAADVNVTLDLVRRLLAGQHPDLAGLTVEFMANGWDNAMFRVGGELLARLPRREVAAANLLNEQRWLPVLAADLQLPIPAPERTGVPAYGYPYSWSVVPYLPGEPAADLAVAWMLLPLEHHATFRAAYRSAQAGRAGSLDPAAWTALWARARGWAVGFALVFLTHSDDNPQLLTVGRRTLDRVLG